MMKHQGRSILKDSQSGQELVEFALVLPLLLLVVFGVLDLGRVFHSAITITNAAREGARYAMLHPDDVMEIQNVTLAEAENSGIDMSTSFVDVICLSDCSSGTPIRVTVEYNFTFLLIGFVFPDPNLVFVRSAEMMIP